LRQTARNARRPRPTRRMPTMSIHRQWLSIHELLELLAGPTVLPDPVTVGGEALLEELVGGRMTTTVDTPVVVVEGGGGTELVAVKVEVVAV